jgi:CheY-like chemotaxis protein
VRVLVVDDNATTRAGIAYYLDSLGIYCETVTVVAEAIDTIARAAPSERPVELVVLNVNLPQMAGLDLLDAMRESPASHQPKVVVLSSAAIELNNPADNFIAAVLVKPIGPSLLRDAILDTLAPSSVTVEPEPLAQTKVEEPDRTDQGLLVLAADDDPVNRIVTGELLARLGLRVETADNGREAIDMAARTDYAAIFMDCQMPVIDGFEATREIRKAEDGRHVPIIAVTAMTMPGDRGRCLEAGMDAYLSKPVRTDDLELAVRQFLPAGAIT